MSRAASPIKKSNKTNKALYEVAIKAQARYERLRQVDFERNINNVVKHIEGLLQNQAKLGKLNVVYSFGVPFIDNGKAKSRVADYFKQLGFDVLADDHVNKIYITIVKE